MYKRKKLLKMKYFRFFLKIFRFLFGSFKNNAYLCSRKFNY